MTNYIVTNDELTSLANIIRAKSGTSNSLTFPNDFIDAIDSISTGSNYVNFRDYDGTIVRSYSAASFANLTELPSNPDHTAENLTAQGWNWTLSDAKTYVAKYGHLEIGQMYITTDGKTHIHIRLKQGRTSPMLGVCPNGTVDVDWGDGTAHDTLTGTSTTEVQWTSNHNYTAPGDYVIKLTVTGSMGLHGNSVKNQYSGLLRYSSSADGRNISYQSSILNVNIGDNVTSINSYAFYGCYNLSNITIPDSIISIAAYAFYNCYSLSSITIPDILISISTNTFYNCYSLLSITIPNSVTSIENYAFQNCYNLSSITIPDSMTSISTGVFQNCYNISSIIIPDNVTSIGNSAFNGCRSLSNVIISNNVTSIGSSAFNGCYSLLNVIISNNVTSIGSSAFNGCYSLLNITIPKNVTSIGESAFNGCYSLSNITIPDNMTSIGNNAFQYCYNISSITIPDGVTIIGAYMFGSCPSLFSITIPNSVTTIDNYVFSVCYSLSSITIPASVTSIGNNAFYGCCGMAEYHFKSTTPPTITSSTFSGISADCIIYVPYSADHSILDAYKTATNWSAQATKMQEEPQ